MTSFGSFADQAAKVGKFLCCLCFEGFPPSEAWEDETGQKWDMCKKCGAMDDEMVRRRAAGEFPFNQEGGM